MLFPRSTNAPQILYNFYFRQDTACSKYYADALSCGVHAAQALAIRNGNAHEGLAMSKLDQHSPTLQEIEHAESALSAHGLTRPPLVEVMDYNARLRDGDGFLGDRASKRPSSALSSRSGSGCG